MPIVEPRKLAHLPTLAIINEPNTVGTCNGGVEILKAALIPPKNILRRNVVPAGSMAGGNALYVDARVFSRDKHQRDFITCVTRLLHHPQRVTACKGRLNSERSSAFQKFRAAPEHFAPCLYGRLRYIRRIDLASDGVRIEMMGET